MDGLKKKEIRERQTLYHRQIFHNAIAEKRWLVAIFIKLFFSFLVRQAIDVESHKSEIADHDKKHKKRVSKNPFIYRMR